MTKDINSHHENSYPSENDRELYKAILRLRDIDEAVKFFRDLLTYAEIKEIANRWEMVRLLDQGLPYWEVAKKIGCSTTTVTRTAHWLNHGLGGYQLVLARMKKK